MHHSQSQQVERTTRRQTLCVIYVKDTSDKVGVPPVVKQRRTLKNLIARVKGPQKIVDKDVVYQMTCAQRDEVYLHW